MFSITRIPLGHVQICSSHTRAQCFSCWLHTVIEHFVLLQRERERETHTHTHTHKIRNVTNRWVHESGQGWGSLTYRRCIHRGITSVDKEIHNFYWSHMKSKGDQQSSFGIPSVLMQPLPVICSAQCWHDACFKHPAERLGLLFSSSSNLLLTASFNTSVDMLQTVIRLMTEESHPHWPYVLHQSLPPGLVDNPFLNLIIPCILSICIKVIRNMYPNRFNIPCKLTYCREHWPSV